MTAVETLGASGAAADATSSSGTPAGWVRVCAVSDLELERGRAALIGGEQVALFLVHDGGIHAVQQRDPYSGAYVMARGIVGTRDGAPTVASPMFKQVFDLRTGVCLETQGKDPKALTVWPVAIDDGAVFIRWKGDA